ncbi:hypothetical protein WJX72_009798 [[Myrmecia] bisecta]|uniref:Uncharacterized protein n=1 Tax=[Myrmecia] bisecta TaxID=41462 RepID=A0AAW1Q834_9CHLO
MTDGEPANGTANGGAAYRLEKFNKYMHSLNEQFLGWAKQQWDAKPTKPWTHGMTDYLRHCVIIRRDFADVLVEEASTNGKAKPEHQLQLTILPLQYSKVIHFIRHGEGFHNIGLLSEDAHLTEYGWQQAKALRAHIASLAQPLRIQLVVTSPMRRTLETTAGVFGSPEPAASGQLLMLSQTELPHCRTAHGEIYCTSGLPIIAFEGCRERLGPSICDRRADVKIPAKDFPGIDLTRIPAGPDQVYDKHAPESEHAVQERSAKFLQWLMARPESEIAVVTHCAFLFLTLAPFGHECAAQLTEQLHRSFENCEMRSVIMADAAGAAVVPPNVTHFPGGHAWEAPGRTSC